jgi:hypothetical protein
MSKKNTLMRVAAIALRYAASAIWLGGAATGQAATNDSSPDHTFGAQLAYGIGQHKVDEVDLGLVWDPGLTWWEIGGWHFALTGEAHVAYWHTSEGAFHNNVYVLGVQPMVRFIKDSGAIRPYVEAGAGVRWLSHARITDTYSLGTAFQFTEVVGVGAQFGAHQQYQAGFRFQHISNAGIKEPNPGINFSQLYVQYNF